MATIRGKSDENQEQVREKLDAYERDHANAHAELYRQNSASIRIRILDDRFAGMPRSSRHKEVWNYLEALPEEVQQQITVLLLLPTAELKNSLMNLEFEQPLPAGL